LPDFKRAPSPSRQLAAVATHVIKPPKNDTAPDGWMVATATRLSLNSPDSSPEPPHFKRLPVFNMLNMAGRSRVEAGSPFC